MALLNESFNKVQKFNTYTIVYKGLNIISLSQIFVFEHSLGRLISGGFFSKLKIVSLDNYLKAIISFFYLFRKNSNKKIEYLFINDVYNQSMISNMRDVSKSFADGFVEIVCDKRILQKDSVFLFKFFTPLNYFKELFKLFEVNKSDIKEIKKLSTEFKIHPFLLIMNIIESIFIINCIEGFFRKYKSIKSITLNSDAHKVSRAFVLYARTKNIKTKVIQHGSTVLEYGYLPVLADTIFTWGSISNDWFLTRGTSKNQLKITGTPKTDRMIKYDIINKDITEVKDILLVINPIGNTNVEKVLEIIKTSGLHNKYNLKIKLHPGSIDNKEQVEKYFLNTQAKIYKKENIHELIMDSDIVITTTSTVGNEAIAFYKPLIQLEISEINVQMEYNEFNCSHSIKNSYSLDNLLDNLELLNSKKTNYENFITEYFYKLDGGSAFRIINGII